jgi:hypothetical protein
MNTVVKVNGFEIEISGGLHDAFVKVTNSNGDVIADLEFDQDMPALEKKDVEHVYIKMTDDEIEDSGVVRGNYSAWRDADLIIQEQISHLDSVVYSAYINDEKGNPKDNLSEIAIHGEAKILWTHAWVQEGHEAFKPTVIVNPTWLDLCGVANSAIALTGDLSHIYFEGVVWDGKNDGYQLVMGS